MKSLAFQHNIAGPSTLILASGSQDGTIRLWSVEPVTKKAASSDESSAALTDELLDSFEASLGDVGEGEEGGRQISMKRHIFSTKNKDGRYATQRSGPPNSDREWTCSPSQFSITFDALLIGHEAGVTSLSWRPSQPTQPMLLSTSTDSSVILWAPTSMSTSTGSSTSLWINQQRFGDLGGQRLGGFVGGIWTRNGADVLAWGWSGGWRRWRSQANAASSGIRSRESWREVSAITGHRGPVQGISWSPGGEYLISTG